MPDAAHVHLTFTHRGFGLGWHMAIQRRTKSHGLRVILGGFLLATGGASVSYAQDSVGNTPPELRDFRLDPTPRETPPEPDATEPAEQPPATQPTVEPTPTPIVRQPNPSIVEPQRTAPAAPANQTPDEQTAPETETPLLETVQTPDEAPRYTEAAPQTDALNPPEPGGMGASEIAAWVGLLLAIAGGAFSIWRRRRLLPSAVAPRAVQTKRPVAPRQNNPPTPRDPVVPTPKRSTERTLSMAFAPDNAVVSFNSLTIRGQLQITNAGDAAAENLSLSTILISASNEQHRAIDDFFANAGDHTPTPLSLVKPGESIGLPIKLAVALSEMQTFTLQEKTLLAPILLAKLDNLSPDGTGQEVARLVCMIGREFSPPHPKMGPLRLDQGPRSFDRLGQRALLS